MELVHGGLEGQLVQSLLRRAGGLGGREEEEEEAEGGGGRGSRRGRRGVGTWGRKTRILEWVELKIYNNDDVQMSSNCECHLNLSASNWSSWFSQLLQQLQTKVVVCMWDKLSENEMLIKLSGQTHESVSPPHLLSSEQADSSTYFANWKIDHWSITGDRLTENSQGGWNKLGGSIHVCRGFSAGCYWGCSRICQCCWLIPSPSMKPSCQLMTEEQTVQTGAGRSTGHHSSCLNLLKS